MIFTLILFVFTPLSWAFIPGAINKEGQHHVGGDHCNNNSIKLAVPIGHPKGTFKNIFIVKYNPAGTVIFKAVKNRSISRVNANELSFLKPGGCSAFSDALSRRSVPAAGAQKRAGLSGCAQSAWTTGQFRRAALEVPASSDWPAYYPLPNCKIHQHFSALIWCGLSATCDSGCHFLLSLSCLGADSSPLPPRLAPVPQPWLLGFLSHFLKPYPLLILQVLPGNIHSPLDFSHYPPSSHRPSSTQLLFQHKSDHFTALPEIPSMRPSPMPSKIVPFSTWLLWETNLTSIWNQKNLDWRFSLNNVPAV